MPAKPRHSPDSRNDWFDVLKGAACLVIVCHHLAVYGPLAQSAALSAPGVSAWFFDYGRMAVQIFLVLGGYLAAASLAPGGVARFERVDTQIARRFMRLAVPYAAALAFAVCVAALVRLSLDDGAVPDAPSLAQLLANALMLQDLLHLPALSAGAWYVAIDLQLFTSAALMLALARQVSAGNHRLAAVLGLGMVMSLCAASLWWLNRNPALDVWGWYFFGAYGLGMAVFWALRSAHSGRWLLVLLALGISALTVEYRPRLVLALATALAIVVLVRLGDRAVPAFVKLLAAPLVWVGRRSYSIFLIHFSICLAVNAVFASIWPGVVAAHWVGLAFALGLSLVAGRWLFERVERRDASPVRVLRWHMHLASAGALAVLAQGVVLA